MPPASSRSTVATGIRRFRTQGTPPIWPGSTVMRSKFFILSVCILAPLVLGIGVRSILPIASRLARVIRAASLAKTTRHAEPGFPDSVIGTDAREVPLPGEPDTRKGGPIRLTAPWRFINAWADAPTASPQQLSGSKPEESRHPTKRRNRQIETL